ncbi:hypothetical protein B0T22DRAFT_500868 [Podospora appendiculata]|uniref:Zn(2)-C6 fungal-type domain-containing protein n=1 Tax=Podospora appendiculata TaxID=314037 RepID=A0AAE1CB69_9PEZI|nr:hypothetical protein B0T22DRAFT_500868 [Podospora appendiculata]
MSASPQPQKRTAQTCITCRARKVRCDGRRGICTNCDRLGFPCSYDETVHVAVEPNLASSASDPGPARAPAPASTSTTIAVPRRRARQACGNCHAKKARCSGAMPSCDRCRVQGLECVYRPGKRSLPLPPPPPPHVSGILARPSSTPEVAMMPDDAAQHSDHHTTFTNSNTASLSPTTTGFDLPDPDDTLALRAFDTFFRHIHHIPMFAFLHRASLMECYHAGLLDRALVLALVGIAALLTDIGPGMADHGQRCIDDAVTICTAELEKPSIPRLQALVIAVKHRILSKRFSSAFMLHAIASRFATVLRLNHENPGLCFLAQESRRRLMWSLYMIDSSISSGQADFALWADPESQIHVQLPCNERNFEFDLPETTEPLRPPPADPAYPGGAMAPMPDALGFIALHVRIHWMRTRILQCTIKMRGAPSPIELASLPAECAELVAELVAFEDRLPLSFRWSEGNLRLRTYSPRLGIFVMTHVWWRQCHLDLYRLFLPRLPEALAPPMLAQLDPRFVAHNRRGCYEHARAMADMFAQLLALPGNSGPVTDIDLPGCAFQCSRMLYHGLQTAGPELGFTPARVQELALVCLRAARQSTGGPACASIQAEIEKLIANGLSLAPGEQQDPTSRTRDMDNGSSLPPTVGYGEMPNFSQSIVSPTISVPIARPGPPPSTMPTQSAVECRTAPVSVAPSHASAGTSGSNAFEEPLDGLDFGSSELFAGDSWAGLSSDWLNMGNFPSGAT